MDHDRAREILARIARESFGRLLELREVQVVRRASGRCFVGHLVCATQQGELRVGQLEIDEQGNVVDDFTAEELIEALKHSGDTSQGATLPESPEAPEDHFLDEAPSEPTDDLDQFLGALVEPDLRERVGRLLDSGDRAALLEARDLLPRLLTHREGRGGVLEQMAQLEARLGEEPLALNYLEAAAREFADAADLEALARVADESRRMAGEAAWGASPTRALLERAREQQRPLARLSDAPIFARLPPDVLTALVRAAADLTAAPGEPLLVEGAEAQMAFVIRAGRVAVCLETPGGGARVVRCCTPGDLIGEASVLGEPGATCSATLRAEGPVRLWRFRGADLRALCGEHPELRERIETARSTHQLDSFFSMREDADALDARVRDGILACISGIRRVPTGELLIPAGEPPATVYLVVDGAVEHRVAGEPPTRHERDAFVGLYDALHDLAVEGEYVAVEDSSVVGFHGRRLKELAANAPPELVAALERFR